LGAGGQCREFATYSTDFYYLCERPIESHSLAGIRSTVNAASIGKFTMALDFRNANMLWTSVLAETLKRLGLQTAIICPGSRSAPLAVAFAQHPTLESIPVLDERSAAFFALGIARRTGLPVALVCTSGTAGANFYPAIIEAHESHVPLVMLTADRPPELRHCHAGQAINQVNLYGSYPNWQAELALPMVEPQMLAYLRQTIVQGWERSQFPIPGPVHLNIPFREPLVPVSDPEVESLAQTFDEPQFFSMVQPLRMAQPLISADLPLQTWLTCDRGLIVAGPAIPRDAKSYCQAIGQLSRALGWPVFAEGLSPLRNYADLNPSLISTYEIALTNCELAASLRPNQIIRIGELPTSKALRRWLQDLNIPQWIIEPSDQNVDPLHSPAVHLRMTVEAIAQALSHHNPAAPNAYSQAWQTIESRLRGAIAKTFQHTEAMHESKAAWLLSQRLPPKTPVFISNSMPVRDAELFWQPGQREIQPYFNRGANGIDGILSSALGIAHHQQGVLLTGDLALLHDINGFLLQPHWQGHLTIVLMNNNGGGIFEMLPISNFEPPFETFFATPQQADVSKLCAAYSAEHIEIYDWDELAALINPLPASGIRVLEIKCDRKADAQWRKETLHRLSVESLQ
jgi:2-succinyl-5-enolpyruvyl-6-hydroxy-3-cyclohexene-1-carboxylate synthase